MDEQGAKHRWKPLLSLDSALAILAGVVATVARWWRRRPVERPSVLSGGPPRLAAVQIASIGFPYIAAQGTAIVFITVTIPSAAQKDLKLGWLQQPADYGFVGLVVLVWALILGIAWWLISPEEYTDSLEECSASSVDEGGQELRSMA